MPSGSALYIRNEVGQLYRVDSTGALLAIGAPQPFTPGIQITAQGTFDPITKASYVVEIGSWPRKDLVQIDTTTGTPLSGVRVDELYGGVAAASDGTVYGMGNFARNFKLQTVNLGSGALTVVAGASANSGYEFNAQAIHPINGMLYVFKEDYSATPSTWTLVPFNTATGVVSSPSIDIDETTLGANFAPKSMAIDTNGVFWVLAEGPQVGGVASMRLYSFVISSNVGRATIVSSYDPPFYAASLWLAPFDTPAPAPGPAPSPSSSSTLAKTGGDARGIIAATLLLVAIGSAMWSGRRLGMARN